jgi:protein phosphatase 1G
MGAYLATPITTKETFEGTSETVQFGGGSMQGWRRTMEDAHIAETNLAHDLDCSIFGVFDGHGGAEVAKFCQKYMASEIKKLGRFNEGAIEDSLVEVFHRMDDMLRDHTYAEELEQLKTKEDADEEESRGDADGDAPMSMDALEMIKRVFQIKRWQGDQPPGSGPEGSNSSGQGDSSGEVSADIMATEPSAAEEAPPEAAAAAGPAANAAAVAGLRAMEPADRVQAGCTAVVAVKYGNDLFVANAGDSRGVLCRGSEAVALSEDHKPAQESERNRILNAGEFGGHLHAAYKFMASAQPLHEHLLLHAWPLFMKNMCIHISDVHTLLVTDICAHAMALPELVLAIRSLLAPCSWCRSVCSGVTLAST